MHVRSVLRDALGAYFRRWWELVPRALLIYLALSLVALAAGRVVGGALGVVASSLGTIMGLFWLQAMHVLEGADAIEGGGEPVGRTFRRAARRLVPLLVASVVYGIAVGLGFLLLVVPGIVLMVWWSMLVPAIVLEGHGVRAAFGRSRRLVRGHGWKVAATLTAATLIAAPVAVVLALVVSFALGDRPETAAFVTELVVDPVTAPFLVLVWTATYFRLRDAETPAAVAAEPRLAAA